MTNVKEAATATKAVLEVSANPAQIEWPQDEYRVTPALRAAGLTAAGRVGTDDAKLKVLCATLDTIKAHAIGRCKKNRTEQEASLVHLQVAAEEEAVRNEKRRLAEVARLEAQLAYVKGAEVAAE